MALSSTTKQVLLVGGIAALTLAGYKLIVKDKNPVTASKEAVKDVVMAPVKVVEAVFTEGEKTAKKISGAALNAPKKGSESAKAWGEKMKAAREAKRAARKITPEQKPEATHEMVQNLRPTKNSHKGHATKRGLRQDQQRVSQEPHEQKYRKLVEGFK